MEKEDKKRIDSLDILKNIFYILLVITIAIAIKTYVFSFVKVNGASMETTLYDGDIYFVSKLGQFSGDYSRFDIVIFKPYSKDNAATNDVDESEQLYIKRVVGLPGETITITSDSKIVIACADGTFMELDDKYCLSDMNRGIDWNYMDGNNYETVTLGSDEYFVLGDNRAVSKDSRTAEIGAVNKKSIFGRCIFRIWPF